MHQSVVATAPQLPVMHGEQNQPYVHARTMVEGVCGVWLVKQVNDAIDDGVDVVDGLPLIPQDVEAHVALVVNVGVVDLHGMENPNTLTCTWQLQHWQKVQLSLRDVYSPWSRRAPLVARAGTCLAP